MRAIRRRLRQGRSKQRGAVVQQVEAPEGVAPEVHGFGQDVLVLF